MGIAFSSWPLLIRPQKLIPPLTTPAFYLCAYFIISDVMSKKKKNSQKRQQGEASRSDNDHNGDFEDDADQGEWKTATQKKKKNKPLTLNEFHSGVSNGGQGQGNGQGAGNSGYSQPQSTFIRTHGTVLKPVPPTKPDLNQEEEVVAESLLSYFVELIKRVGPVLKLDSALISKEIQQLEEDPKKVFDRFPSLEFFLTQSQELTLVDDLVCLRLNLEQAQQQIIESVDNNAHSMTMAMNVKQNTPKSNQAAAAATTSQRTPNQQQQQQRESTPPYTPSMNAMLRTPNPQQYSSLVSNSPTTPTTATSSPRPPGTPNAAAGNAWSTPTPTPTPNASSPFSINPLPYRPSTQELNSNATTSDSGGGLDLARQVVTPPKSNAQAPNAIHQRADQSSASTSRSGFGSIGNIATSPNSQRLTGNNVAAAAFAINSQHPNSVVNLASNASVIESLNKRLQGLTKTNTDLLREIREKDDKIAELNQQVTALQERCRQYEQQLQSVNNVNGGSGSGSGSSMAVGGASNSNSNGSSNGGDSISRSSTPASTSTNSESQNQVILTLQKKLDNEKLTSMSLRQQLEIERIFSNKLAEKTGVNQQNQQQQQPQNGHQQQQQQMPPVNGNANDALGLKGLLSVTSNNPIASNSLPNMSSLSTVNNVMAAGAATPPSTSQQQPQQPGGLTLSPSGCSIKANVFASLRRQYLDLTVPEFERHWRTALPRSNYSRSAGASEPQAKQILQFIGNLIETERRMK